MKSNFEEHRATLVALCEKTLQGGVGLEEFIAVWPEAIAQTEFVRELFDDLEDGIEHFPGHWFSNKKNFKAWEESYMAYKLRVDAQLLASDLSEERMFALRKTIIDKDIKDEETIKRLISEQE